MPESLSFRTFGILCCVLVLFTIVALLLAGARYFYLHRARVDTFELLRGLMNQLRAGRVKEAVANCDNRKSPIEGIFRIAIENWRNGEDTIRYEVENYGMLAIQSLEKNLKLLASFANFLPIAGFMGTVICLMSAFDKIASNDSFDAKLISYDIKYALICLALGLLASLLCQICHAVLVEKVDHILEEMNRGALEIIFFLTHNPPPKEEEDAEGKK